MRRFPMPAKTQQQIEDIVAIKRVVMTWLWTKADHEPRYAEQRELLRQLGSDAWHSELLERLLQGQEPRENP